MKLLKKKLPDSIEEYCSIRIKADTQWYKWTNDVLWYMIFEEKAKSKKAKAWKITPEWLEFINEFRTINKKGSYSDTLVRKYEIVLEKTKHSDIMNNLKDYKRHIIEFNKLPLQVWTYLNQNRFMDDWETVKVNYEEKWIDEHIKLREIPQECIEPIMWEVGNWKAKHWDNPSMEFTTFKLDAIIDKYYITK